MRKTITQKRLEFLEETIAYYSENPNIRRCQNLSGSCMYSNKEKSTSEGCAIGRHISKELAIEFDAMDLGAGVSNERVFTRLPKKLQALGRLFLIEIQMLHDTSSYWESSGLSEEGKIKVENIKEKFNLL